MRLINRLWIIGLLLSAIVACESNPPAPVVNRSPQATKPSKAAPSVQTVQPDSYIVKKGDTLYSISLEFGYDYKEVAAANHIGPPYAIQIGQRLNFTSLKNKDAALATTNDAEVSTGVVVSPINIETSSTEVTAEEKPVASSITPLLTEPKAMREPYSLEALNRPTTVVKQVETKTVVTLPANPVSTTATTSVQDVSQNVEGVAWSWPTAGKVTSPFNEASNKGIDIAGSLGQPVQAAAAGKVIYAGSDLRGYGKLVIIKHNSTFLSVYAHNSKIIAKEGQSVVSGQKIAEMGNSDTNAMKLHFEIRRLGKSVDPAEYLPQR